MWFSSSPTENTKCSSEELYASEPRRGIYLHRIHGQALTGLLTAVLRGGIEDVAMSSALTCSREKNDEIYLISSAFYRCHPLDDPRFLQSPRRLASFGFAPQPAVSRQSASVSTIIGSRFIKVFLLSGISSSFALCG